MSAEQASASATTPTLDRTTSKPISAADGPRCNAERASQSRRIGSKCGPACVRPTPAQAHCSVCHVSLGGISGFDAHRKTGDCVHPSILGMVERDGVWRKPMPEDVAERLRAARGDG